MDIQNILSNLKMERERIDRAIARRRGRPVGSVSKTSAGRPRRHMSAAARKRISEMMKQRWAERKRKSK
jgi:hypothetical protein